jgi:hypothetical protein
MPRRRVMPIRTSANRDIEVVRKAIQAGIPWQPEDQHRELARFMSIEQQFVLNKLVPEFKTVAQFLAQLDVNDSDVEVAREALADDIAAAQERFG